MVIQELIMVIVASLAGIISLILVLLQKKGIIKPILIQVTNGFEFTSGGTILLFSTVIGGYILFKYSKIVSILYVSLFAVVYFLIQIVGRNKK
ncbi:MAG: hypothetical protein IKL49_01330 [Lachnospiraceae bacterium]|nr:hypothetical protein [Lachnospiraceae bacterium]